MKTTNENKYLRRKCGIYKSAIYCLFMLGLMVPIVVKAVSCTYCKTGQDNITDYDSLGHPLCTYHYTGVPYCAIGAKHHDCYPTAEFVILPGTLDINWSGRCPATTNGGFLKCENSSWMWSCGG